MARTPRIAALILFLVTCQRVTIGDLWAQAPGSATHEHLTEVACVDVPAGEIGRSSFSSDSPKNQLSAEPRETVMAQVHQSRNNSGNHVNRREPALFKIVSIGDTLNPPATIRQKWSNP